MGSECNSKDATSLHPSEPTPCSNGCGFFGTTTTKGLCSKCYRDLTIHESQVVLAKSSVEKSFTTPALSIKTVENKVAPKAESSAKADEGHQLGVLEKKTVKNRCGKCNRKVRLTGFRCSCDHTFCGSPRYAEEHDCDFDFKAKAKSEIAKANPVVKDNKLERF